LTAYGTITSGGVTAGLSAEYGGLTPSDSEGYLIRPLPAAAGIVAGLHQIGHGVEMTQQVSGLSGVFESFVGEQKAASGSNGITITVVGIKNGVEYVLYTTSTVRYCVRVVVPFVGFDQIKMTVIANAVGARYIRVTETRIWIGDYANRPIIDKNGNYLMSKKDAGGMVYLMRNVEQVDRNGNSIEALKVFVTAAWNLNDKWIRANFTPNTLYGQFSKIFTGYQTSSPEMIEKKKNDRIAELLAEKMKQYENQ